MNTLPEGILQSVAELLSPTDALSLSRTSKQLFDVLHLASTPHCRFIDRFSVGDCDDSMHYGFELPSISPISVHTLLISMQWSDQGWGNRKGRIMIVAEDKNQSLDRHRAEYNRVVFASKIASHSRKQLRIEIKPKQNESYHLFYAVGGGGGHSLVLFNISVQALLFDDNKKSTATAFNFLVRSNALRRWDNWVEEYDNASTKAVIASTKYLLLKGKAILPPLAEYFKSYGISSRDLSLSFVDAVEKASDDWARLKDIYSRTWRHEEIGDVQSFGRSVGEESGSDSDGEDSFHNYATTGMIVGVESEYEVMFDNRPSFVFHAGRRALHAGRRALSLFRRRS